MADFRASWWWIDRWRKSTAYTDMTLAEQGAYRNLLDELWLRGGVLPFADRILAKISGDAIEWPKVRDAVLLRFRKTDDGWRNDTHDEIAAQSRSFRDAQSDAGKARAKAAKRGPDGRFTQPGGPAGWSSRNQPNIQPELQPTNQPPSPSPSPDQEPSPKRRAANAARSPVPGKTPQEVIDKFVGWWNRAIEGKNLRAIAKLPTPKTQRGKRILAYVRDALKATPDERVVPFSILGAVSQEFIDERPDRLTVDWLLRDRLREKHIEFGLDEIHRRNGDPARAT